MRASTPALLLLSLVLGACPSGRSSPDHRTENAWRPLDSVVAHCGATSCKSCCLPDGHCAVQLSDTVCGKGGERCVDCTITRGRCVDGICKQDFQDSFDGVSLDGGRWGTAASGADIKVQGGELVLSVPAQPNVWAEVYSKESFPVGSTFEAEVTLTANQFYDHRGLGFSERRVGNDCNDPTGEQEAVQWRGQDYLLVGETKHGASSDCNLGIKDYPAGARTLKIVRQAAKVEFYENGRLEKTVTDPTRLPTAPLPVRFSAYTYATIDNTVVPIVIRVRSVKVVTP